MAALPICAQSSGGRVRNLGEVVAVGRRPMKEIGVQKTVFDSLQLKENIALSMADVLTFNSPVFVKSYGRATLSTVAFRGTSPSHTQVTWNGMRINNPMLGMTDFSTIPSYFVDNASLLHGSSSVNETGGGLGGLVKLSTLPDVGDGLKVQYIQGIGSFKTFDEFARVTYGNEHWTTSTRVVYSSSPNDYTYTNHDKKINVYDNEGNIIDSYHPRERNRSGAYKDFHLLQEIGYSTGRGDRFGLNAWLVKSNRELPMLTTDYGDERQFENRQRETTLRSIATWDHLRSSWKTTLSAGYLHTWMGYDYRREVASDNWATMTRSRSVINTVYGRAEGEYNPTKKWYLTANIAIHQHFIKSHDKNVLLQDNQGNAVVGYNNSRMEMSGAVSAKWQPTERLGLSTTLRQEIFGDRTAPIVPALFADYLLSRNGNIMVKASATRNHKFPTLNDLYFLPGGNPDLKSESGWSYDAGMSFAVGSKRFFPLTVSGSATWFDSRIDDWIIWLPTTKGFFSPRNIRRVHAYGIESRLNIGCEPIKNWILDLNATYSWTPSINQGDKYSAADQSTGKQLPYVPLHSASLTGRLTWRDWSFLYKWAYYSERFTMSSNEYTITGHLPAYFMSNISIERTLRLKPMDLQMKVAVNNLFNEDYLSVLSRPMPGINFEVFIAVTPKF